MRKERGKAKRKKWRKRRKGKKRGKEERGMKEAKGNHRVHCWHVARLALLHRRVPGQQRLELGCRGASAGKIACATGCLLKELVLIEITIRNQGYRFRLAAEQGIHCREKRLCLLKDEKNGRRKEEQH